MTVCELCGSSKGHLVPARVEGSLLTVCESCARYGTQVHTSSAPSFKKKPLIAIPESTENVVEDYAILIKQKREKLGLNQEDFAKMLNEKVSLIHHWEAGHGDLNIPLAKKLEKLLKIKLIEQDDAEPEQIETSKSKAFTMADFLKKG